MPLIMRREDTGAIIFNSNDRMSRLVTTMAIFGNGSYSFAGIEGEPFYFVRYPPTNEEQDGDVSITLNAGTRVLQWSGVKAGTQIVLGVF